MEKEVLIKVDGISKKFSRDLKKSLRYGLQDIGRELLGKPRKTELRKSEFWAVQDISFEVRRGECMGLIGHNGAGKSTLLKILNGLIKPDKGRIEMRGRVSALIELGAGFNPILTGRENIYNNASVLGFSREDTDAKFDEIVAFSELGDFIDTPVQSYSSGMKVRLGFAVAAQMEPDVLIIDEVLAVGDLGFVLKCFKRIDQILPNCAVIFVSHSMPTIARICNKIIFMKNGKSQIQGNEVSKGIDMYYSSFNKGDDEFNLVFTDGTTQLKSIAIEGETINNVVNLRRGQTLNIDIELEQFEEVDDLEMFVIILDKDQRPIASFESNAKQTEFTTEKGLNRFRIGHENIQLSKGLYNFHFAIRRAGTKEPVLRVNNVTKLQVLHEEQKWEPFLLDAHYTKLNK